MHWGNCKRYNGVNIRPTALGLPSFVGAASQIPLWPPQGGTVCPHAQIQRETSFLNDRIRCVLVHDHVLLRQGLRSLLDSETDLEVVAEAGNAAEALQRVCEHQPAVVIADATTLGMSARDAENLFLSESPQSQMLFLTANRQEDIAPADERGGESGCTFRQTSAEELVRMVRYAARKADSCVREISQKHHSGWQPSGPVPAPRRVLTAREREVLKLLAEGRTVRSAASVLGVSAKTVDAHKFNLMRKLGIHNKAELVMWAIQERVVKVPVNF
jgi:two-component system response regulator NreC